MEHKTRKRQLTHKKKLHVHMCTTLLHLWLMNARVWCLTEIPLHSVQCVTPSRWMARHHKKLITCQGT